MKISLQKLYELFLKHPHVITDSRNTSSDSIFFALQGEKFNGNKFAEDALRKGAAYAIVDDKSFVKDERFLLVDNVLMTLQELAKTHISALNIPVIGITGTNGKTTTKELVNNVLSKKYLTQATPGNLNNHIGVPLTILSVKAETEILVVEMGANHIGEIQELCHIASPAYGIITNIGKAHLEGFGGKEGIVKAKSELYDYLNSTGGTAFVNSSDPLLMELSQKLKSFHYGLSPEADIIGEIADVNPFLSIKWRYKNTFCESQNRTFRINSQLIGEYNLGNILVAVSVGCFFKIDPEDIVDAIEKYIPVNNRSQIIEKPGKTIILDAYNANPSNVEAAVLNLDNMPGKNKITILGEMLELGEYKYEEHKKILKLLKDLSINNCLFIGPTFSSICSPDDGLCFENTDDAYEWIKNNPLPPSVILVKASRGMQLEKLVDIL